MIIICKNYKNIIYQSLRLKKTDRVIIRFSILRNNTVLITIVTDIITELVAQGTYVSQ